MPLCAVSMNSPPRSATWPGKKPGRDQQRPPTGRQRSEVRAAKRAVRKRPSPLLAHDQPRLHVVATGELHQRRTVEEAAESRQGIPYEQRLLLPMTAEKTRGSRAAEQRARRIRHAAIVVGGARATSSYNSPRRPSHARVVPRGAREVTG